MIPVREDVFKKINFKNIENEYYKKILETEYRFCMKIQKNILEKANKIYKYQKETGKILKMYCNFEKLEEKMKKWEE